MESTQVIKPKPFVKWAGGKRQLIDILLNNIPLQFNTYIEPFVGGGALLFELMPEHAIIADINPDIINAYQIIKNNVNKLIRSLQDYINTEEFYYKIRSENHYKLPPIQRASHFIYLNKTCYNGLYRVNSKGKFNVPYGRYKTPKIVDKENLRAVSEYLNSSNTIILCQHYKETILLAQKGDFIYLDPPYHPLNNTSSFTKYSKEDFTIEDQIELSNTFKELDNKGCYVLLSNSNTQFILNLYENYNIQKVKATRAINCKASRRKQEYYEVLIKNYD